MLPNVAVGKLPRRAHLAVDIEEELTTWGDFTVQRFDRGAGIRRVMKHSVSDDEIERFIRERGIHQIRLNDAAVLQLKVFSKVVNAASETSSAKYFARAIFGNEPRIEAGAWPDFEHTLAVPIKRLQCVQIRQPKLLAIPAEQKFLVLRLEAILLEPSPLVGERPCGFGLITEIQGSKKCPPAMADDAANRNRAGLAAADRLKSSARHQRSETTHPSWP